MLVGGHEPRVECVMAESITFYFFEVDAAKKRAKRRARTNGCRQSAALDQIAEEDWGEKCWKSLMARMVGPSDPAALVQYFLRKHVPVVGASSARMMVDPEAILRSEFGASVAVSEAAAVLRNSGRWIPTPPPIKKLLGREGQAEIEATFQAAAGKTWPSSLEELADRKRFDPRNPVHVDRFLNRLELTQNVKRREQL